MTWVPPTPRWPSSLSRPHRRAAGAAGVRLPPAGMVLLGATTGGVDHRLRRP